jgi:hypothetical protein
MPLPGGRLWIDTREPTSGDHCAIYVEATPEARSISEGDALWWQGAWAMWTPSTRAFFDRKIPRIGCSGISRAQALAYKADAEAGDALILDPRD